MDIIGIYTSLCVFARYECFYTGVLRNIPFFEALMANKLMSSCFSSAETSTVSS